MKKQSFTLLILLFCTSYHFAQESTQNSIRISFSSFDNIGDMERKMITGQLPHATLSPEDQPTASANIEEMEHHEVQDVKKNNPYMHSIQVDDHISRHQEIHPAVTRLDKDTNHAHHHLPAYGDHGAEFKSEFDESTIYQADHPNAIYKISVNGEYEYYDGKPLTETKAFRKSHPDGYKPISALTFFYKAQDEGVVVEGVSAHDFLSMTKQEQDLLLHHAIMLMNHQDAMAKK